MTSLAVESPRRAARFALVTGRPSGTFQGLFGPSSGGSSHAGDMVPHAPASIRRLALSMVTSASALPVRAALLAFVAVFVVSLWVVTIAPPLVSLALTVALAIGWCVWLEKNPDPGVPCEAALEAMRAVPGAKPGDSRDRHNSSRHEVCAGSSSAAHLRHSRQGGALRATTDDICRAVRSTRRKPIRDDRSLPADRRRCRRPGERVVLRRPSPQRPRSSDARVLDAADRRRSKPRVVADARATPDGAFGQPGLSGRLCGCRRGARRAPDGPRVLRNS